MSAQHDDDCLHLDSLALLAVFYLALPNFIFLLGWVAAPWSWIMVFMVLIGFQRLLRVRRHCSHEYNWRILFGLTGIAVVWSAFGGAGHFFYANFDWVTRDAVLRDLTIYHWPVTYASDPSEVLILRCPLGYYLPVALLGKLVGAQAVDIVLWVWTALGVTLFLCLLPFSSTSVFRLILGLAVVILFSGLDIVPYWLARLELPAADSHLEWWAEHYQYSSNSTQLFWVPNHALPAWIAGALFLRHWRSPSFMVVAPLLMGLLPLWSPFAWIGMAPFMGLFLVKVIKEGYWRLWRWLDWLPAIFLLVVVIPYLLMDFGRIPGTRWMTVPDSLNLAANYILFVMVEFGLLAILIWRMVPKSVLTLAFIMLLILPLAGHLGPGNDLVMRASIPALLVLCVAVLSVTRDCRFQDDPARFVFITLILLLGAITPIHEFYRALHQSAWVFDPNRGLTELRRPGEDYPAHYVARLNDTAISRKLYRPFSQSGMN